MFIAKLHFTSKDLTNTFLCLWPVVRLAL